MKFKIFTILACAALLTACGKSQPAETEPGVPAASDTDASTTVSETETEMKTDISDDSGKNPLQELADAATSAGEWPSLWEVDDPQMIEDFFLLDSSNENYRNMIVLQCPMSANMTELIIIEADKPYDAAADLEARRKKAIEQDAFYPNDVEKAEAAIIGTKGNYAYFIMADSAKEAEKALIEKIGG